jgi:tryptophan synthase alpha chain
VPAASRLGPAFSSSRNATGLIPYVTAGFPSLDASLAMLRGLAERGARAVEVGIPFSDPIADGPEIQRASEAALGNGVGVDEVLDLVARLRRDSQIPVVLMTYANPVLSTGVESFAARAVDAGVDGVLLSDLPPDESPETWQALDASGLDTIVLVAPTTAPARLPALLARCRGFVYCLARTGVTGRGGGESAGLAERIAEVRRLSALPVAVGFGISTPAQAATLRGVADAVVVGAAFMRAVADGPPSDAVGRVLALGESLIAALR